MSDEIDIEIDGDSAEAVALALLRMVARAEGKLDKDGALDGVDRAWILDTYAECLRAVDGERMPGASDDDNEDEEDDEDEEEDAEPDEDDAADKPGR